MLPITLNQTLRLGYVGTFDQSCEKCLTDLACHQQRRMIPA
jgi:hypothetical protein